MTFAKWQTSTDPQAMLTFLKGKVSTRKLPQIAVGCARQVQYLMKDERSKDALDVAERFVDGLARAAELGTAVATAAAARAAELRAAGDAAAAAMAAAAAAAAAA